MTRFLLSCTTAVLLTAGAAYAQPTPQGNATAPANASTAGTAMPGNMPMKPMAAKPAKPMAHGAMHSAKPMHGARTMGRTTARSRDAGSAAVDQLNEQSLMRAKGG